MNLYHKLHEKLDPKPVCQFDREYLEKHEQVDHAIPELHENITLMEVICFVFDDNPQLISDFLQSYLNNDKTAREILELMRETVEDGNSCITCLKRGIFDYLEPTIVSIN